VKREARKRKAGRRTMTETEHRGYERNHRSVEDAVAREDLKAKDKQVSAARSRSRTEREVANSLRRGNLDRAEGTGSHGGTC